MEILFLIIVLVVLALAVFSSRKEQASKADDRKDQVRQQKEDFAQEDVMTYGQVQQRREDLLNVLDENLGDKPDQRDQIKKIINDWADLKIKAFQDRRSWVRNPDKGKAS
jgi:flagellar biosynthesis/type III secretory pathway M-ring protein FliF/YscJ